jgi:hypothetical protein
MQNTVSQSLAGLANESQRYALSPIVRAIADRLSSQITTTGGLAIKAGGGVLVKTVNTVTYVANGVHGSIVAADMPALTGLNIGAGKFNVACFYVNSAGTTSVRFGVEGATAALVKFPTPPEGSASIGYALITYASAFTGGTTALDTATTVYVNTVGPFDASILL